MAERSWRRPSSETNWQSAARIQIGWSNAGQWQSDQVANLKSTRRRTGSQCSSCSTGVMWSYRRAPFTKSATAFWTDCRQIWRVVGDAVAGSIATATHGSYLWKVLSYNKGIAKTFLYYSLEKNVQICFSIPNSNSYRKFIVPGSFCRRLCFSPAFWVLCCFCHFCRSSCHQFDNEWLWRRWLWIPIVFHSAILQWDFYTCRLK